MNRKERRTWEYIRTRHRDKIWYRLSLLQLAAAMDRHRFRLILDDAPDWFEDDYMDALMAVKGFSEFFEPEPRSRSARRRKKQHPKPK